MSDSHLPDTSPDSPEPSADRPRPRPVDAQPSDDGPAALSSDAAESLATTQGGWTARWVAILTVVVLLSELGSFMPQAIGTSLTPVAEHFRTTDIGWISTLGMLFGGIFAPVIGKAADVYGKKRLMLITTGITVVGGILSALAPTYAVFLLGRGLSSFVGPSVYLSYSIIRDLFPRNLMVVAVSLAGTGIGLTTIATPLLTGWLIDAFGWQGLYWFFGIYPLVAGLLFALVVPESPRREPGRIAFVSAFWLIVGLAGVLVGISEGSTWGWTAGSTLACLVGGAAFIAVWAVSDLRVRQPLIDVRLFVGRPLATTALSASLCYGAMTVNALALPIMVMVPRMLGGSYGFGSSSFGVAAYLVPIGVCTVVFGFISGKIAPHTGIRVLFLTGTLFIGAGLLLEGLIHDQSYQLIVFNCLIGVGEGLTLSSIPNLVIGAVPPEKQAAMASMVTVPQTMLTSVLSQVLFVLLAHNIGLVVQGHAIYSNKGFVIVFVVGAAVSALAFLVGLAIPHGRRPATATAPVPVPAATAA